MRIEGSGSANSTQKDGGKTYFVTRTRQGATIPVSHAVKYFFIGTAMFAVSAGDMQTARKSTPFFNGLVSMSRVFNNNEAAKHRASALPRAQAGQGSRVSIFATTTRRLTSPFS